MEAIKIAVCDDEKNIRSYICSLVRKQGVECKVTEYATAEDYFLAGADYDLLFLDVELKGPDSSMDGMEMAKRIRGMEEEQIKAGTSQPVKVQEEGKGAKLDLTI